MMLATAIIVFREGLEAVLILASLMGSLKLGEQRRYRRPLWWGAVGAVLASAIPLLAATLQFGTAGPFLIIAGTIVALHLVSANLLIPKLIGSRVNIGPVAATVGMLFWSWLWGGAGLLLAVVFITMTINALKMFDLVFAIAPGSVQDDANVIALEMWRTAFTGAGNRGLGAAVAVFLFVLVLPILAFNVRRFRIEEERR